MSYEESKNKCLHLQISPIDFGGTSVGILPKDLYFIPKIGKLLLDPLKPSCIEKKMDV